jgi:hypothetical protein
MPRFALAALLALAVAAPAGADVTLKQTTGGKGMGMNAHLDAQRMFSFDSKSKEADVFDMAAFAEQTLKAVNPAETTASITPNGKTKEIGGQTASGYDMAITMPSPPGPDPSMTMVMNLTGPIWIVKGAPGTDEWAAFYKAAAAKGWIFGDPRAARANLGQARSMVELYRQMAETGGIAYETEINIAMKAEGPMAAMVARMGPVQATTRVDSVTTEALADTLFAPPADYKITSRK